MTAADLSARAPLGLIALHLLDLWRAAGEGGLLYVATSEPRIERLAAILAAFDPDSQPMVLPQSDSLAPSRETMGRRASVLRRIAEGKQPLVLATADATLQEVVPPKAWRGRSLVLKPGVSMTTEKLREFLEHAGYEMAPRVEGPCEASVQGAVVDVYPAGALGPARIEMEDGRIARIGAFDIATQRSSDELSDLVLDAAREFPAGAAEAPRRDTTLVPVFDYFGDVKVVADPTIEERASAFLERADEAAQAGLLVRRVSSGHHVGSETPLQYMALDRWKAWIADRASVRLTDTEAAPAIPRFAVQTQTRRGFREFVSEQLRLKHRVVLAAAASADLRQMVRWLSGPTAKVASVASWRETQDMRGGEVATLRADLDAGFRVPASKMCVIAAADVFGSRAEHRSHFGLQGGTAELTTTLQPDDVVVHLARGVGRLTGLCRVSEQGDAAEMVRLTFDDGSVLVGIHELALMWRYGSQDAAVKLDRLDTTSWEKRRADLEAEIARTATELVDIAHAREQRTAEKLVPPRPAYERFARRFAYSLTPDQAEAIEAILDDLASGRPMDRLVCGDVGYGKTEVALRAAAAAALAGKQVVLAAPTTVLARQHAETFRRRFRGFDIEIGELSRTATAAEQRKVKSGLDDGSIGIVIGTHAVLAKDISFHDLGLVIVDEEQRFGAQQKARLRELAEDVHVLTLTATPIPRTLQMGMAGLRELSIIATPPARRLPVRVLPIALRPDPVRAALQYEKRRGGQSFVVCPRIEDLEPMQAQLRDIVPDLEVLTVHGKMKAADVDDAMVRFGAGHGDVLLATNIIESGLDLPQANTILIWRPDRFGLAQLHQLRGRVGRGERQGFAYLVTDPDSKIAAVSERRLEALTKLDQLGAGFAISERDLDLRGAGDLLGEQQAGHVNLVGPELYRDMLERAMRRARGEAVALPVVPELNIGLSGSLPESYVAEPETRLELYARLAKAPDRDAIDELQDEVADRFGELPKEAMAVFELARLREACARAGVVRVDAGPKAIAFQFCEDAPPTKRTLPRGAPGKWQEGRLIWQRPTQEQERANVIFDALDLLRAAGD